MMKRYAPLFLTALLCVAMAQGATGVAGASQELTLQDGHVAASAARVAYVSILKDHLSSLYARCKEYRELCSLGVALVCAYAAYKLSTMDKKVETACEFDSDDFEFEDDKKGHEAQV